MGIYDSRTKDFFKLVESNPDTPITEGEIYRIEGMANPDGTVTERNIET